MSENLNDNVEIVLALSGPFDKRISVVKCLRDANVSLSKAHAAINALAYGERPRVTVSRASLETLKDALQKLDVTIE